MGAQGFGSSRDVRTRQGSRESGRWLRKVGQQNLRWCLSRCLKGNRAILIILLTGLMEHKVLYYFQILRLTVFFQCCTTEPPVTFVVSSTRKAPDFLYYCNVIFHLETWSRGCSLTAQPSTVPYFAAHRPCMESLSNIYPSCQGCMAKP